MTARHVPNNPPNNPPNIFDLGRIRNVVLK
jgi:hypothetical protein